MRYRKLDANFDMVFGHSQRDFYVDQPEAVAQAVLTRLRLFTGQWFLDTSDGTAWNTQVLGLRTSATRDLVIRSRVAGTQGVTAIKSYASAVNPRTRRHTVQVSFETAYGPTVLAETI